MSDALDFVAAVAPRFRGICHRQQAENTLHLAFAIELVDGSIIDYALVVNQQPDGITLTVRENKPLKLPAFCPQRHINPGGTFCLGYGDNFSNRVDNEDTAIVWLETLYRYLQMQTRAERLRVWPGDEWRHGSAAQYQKSAIEAAALIVPELKFSELSCRVVSVKERRIIEVLYSGAIIFRVWKNFQRVVNKKKPCICVLQHKQKRKRFGRCLDHADMATKLALALEQMDIKENEFWQDMLSFNLSCCNTCNYCPLKKKNS